MSYICHGVAHKEICENVANTASHDGLKFHDAVQDIDTTIMKRYRKLAGRA